MAIVQDKIRMCMNSYDDEIFDDGVFSDSPAVKAAEAIKNMVNG